MMKLYFHPMSGNSRRALLAATHLESPLERIVVDLQKGEQRGAPHLHRNPNGRVPVLEDGDLVLWESRAIMTYLAEKTPGQTVWPSDVRERADVNRWLYWCAAHNAPANGIVVQENFVKPLMGRPQDPVELARGEAQVAQFSGILDAHLAGKQWVALDRLTLADYSLAAAYALAGPAKLQIDSFKHLGQWLARVQELPAWKATNPR
jgi:glutathione S-transferase